MALLINDKVARLLAWNAQNKIATAWFLNGMNYDAADWKLEADGLLSCDVEGTRTYFDPNHVIAVRITPT